MLGSIKVRVRVSIRSCDNGTGLRQCAKGTTVWTHGLHIVCIYIFLHNGELGGGVIGPRLSHHELSGVSLVTVQGEILSS